MLGGIMNWVTDSGLMDAISKWGLEDDYQY